MHIPGSSDLVPLDDGTQQVREQRLQKAEQRVLEMIAAGKPLADVLTALILAIEEHAPPMLGSVLLVDADGLHVVHGAAPHLADAYCRAINGLRIGPSTGSCGTAAFTQKPVIVRDIASDPLWADYREVALAHGLRACWSTPIVSSEGRVLGTFAFYYREPRSPRPSDLELIARASHLAGIALEREQLDQQLRALPAHIEAAREEERTAIAREIHDELGQALTALKMDVVWLARRTDPSKDTPRAVVVEKLDSMGQMIDEVIDQVRRISAELRPAVLDDLGLVDAIEWQAADFERRTGIPCLVRTDVGPKSFARPIATAIFRILQEALTNVVRHAQASRVDVRLTDQGGRARLEVRDDGKGIPQGALAHKSSLGLLGMRERARSVGGTTEVRGEPGGGTLVTVDVPLAAGGAR